MTHVSLIIHEITKMGKLVKLGLKVGTDKVNMAAYLHRN